MNTDNLNNESTEQNNSNENIDSAPTQKQLRKADKKAAKHTFKTHYGILVLLCLILVFFGTEFAYIKGSTSAALPADLESTISSSFRIDASSSGFFGLVDSLAKIGNPDADNPSIFGIPYGKGALSTVVKAFSSGKLSTIIGSAIQSITRSKNAGIILQIIGALLVQAALVIFIFNLLDVAVRRLYMQARTYKKVHLDSLLHIPAVKRWARAAITIFIKTVFQVLWTLTIVGGVIKHYSYFLVPYIIAENPDIKPLEAITLSRRMMNGHKWECFKYEFTFLPWVFLGGCTFGLSEFFYSLPYRLCTFTEFYARLRADAKASCIEGAEKLNDTYLFEQPSASELENAYSYITELEHFIAENDVELHGFRKFLVKYLGIWIGSSKGKKQYHDVEVCRFRIHKESEIKAGLAYPERLNSSYHRAKRKNYVSGANYLTAYSITSLILIFFTFCFIGWMWEVSLHLVNDGVFVNRGAMHGPWLPIYGTGGVFMLIILNRFRSKPVLEISLMVLIAGLLEYFTSYFMEISTGLRWWDYTGYFLNLNGRICAEGLIVFALAGALGVYLVAPLLDNLFNKLKMRTLIIICAVLVCAFVADMIYSHYVPNTGKGITDYNKSSYAPPIAELLQSNM